MQYGEFNTNQSIGVRLCRNVSLGDKYYIKGHILAAEDIDVLKSYDINKVFGVVFEDGDMDYRVALNQIASRVCGDGLGYFTDDDGICKVVALSDGIFMADENRIDKFNGFNEHFILNTITPYSVVKKDDIIAEIEITPTLLYEEEIDEMLFCLSGNESLLKIGKVEEKRVSVIYSSLVGNLEENESFTSVLMKLVSNFDGLGLNFTQEINSRYDKNVLAESLFDAYRNKADIVFVLSPLCSSGYNNALAAGVKMSTDDIVNFSYPQVGASDLIIAQKGKCKIIIVPHSYGRVDTSAIDGLIKQALFAEHMTEATFSQKRASWLSYIGQIEPEKEKLIIKSSTKGNSDKAKVGIVVLAAGQGKRSGTNKLLVENKKGEALFMSAVKAAISSQARPVFVITGYRHEEMEEYLSKYDINILYNPSYATGIGTSISLGLKSMPSTCDGAILLPADMPNITAADINKLINKFDKKSGKEICLFSHNGTKGNPVLWSKELYDKAEIVPENADVRVVFAEHSDYIKIVEVKDKKKLADINFPGEVKEYANS